MSNRNVKSILVLPVKTYIAYREKYALSREKYAWKSVCEKHYKL